jgi:hypothetical protein
MDFIKLLVPLILFFIQCNFAHAAGEIMKRANFTTLEMEMYYDTAAILAVKRSKNQKERLQRAWNKVVPLHLGVGIMIPELKLDTICVTKFCGVYYSQLRNVNSKVCLKIFMVMVIHKISYASVA